MTFGKCWWFSWSEKWNIWFHSGWKVVEIVLCMLSVRVSVTWNVLSWSGGREFEPRLGRTWGAWYFCPKSYLHQKEAHVVLKMLSWDLRYWWLHTDGKVLTLKVLNFWKFTSYCSLRPFMVGHGGSSAGSYLARPYIPHPLPLCINCRD